MSSFQSPINPTKFLGQSHRRNPKIQHLSESMSPVRAMYNLFMLNPHICCLRDYTEVTETNYILMCLNKQETIYEQKLGNITIPRALLGPGPSSWICACSGPIPARGTIMEATMEGTNSLTDQEK